MKKLFSFIIFIVIAINIFDSKFLNNKIYNYIDQKYFNNDYYIITNTNALKINEYKYKNFTSLAVETDNFKPKSKQELFNIYYTILNNGWDKFSFYCDSSYKTCLNDIETLLNDKTTFSYINQLIHPFNNYSSIESKYNSDGRIDIKINKKYSDEDINKIKNKLNDIILKLDINSYNNIYDKIKIFHDYIANTNTYDKDKAENNSSIYNSDTVIGTLFQGKSVCSGYTDTMAIYLNMLGLDNVKVATKNHVWNSVLIDNTWKHIDLTWDDPITTTNQNIIIYDYFMISTNDLKNKNDNEHNYDTAIYNFIK